MSDLVLPNFDWILSPFTKDMESRVLMAASFQYRVAEHGRLIPFDIMSREDISSTKPIHMEGKISEKYLKLFLAKNMLLGWLYVRKDRSQMRPNTLNRLAAYVWYYHNILEEIRSGHPEVLNNWWVVETTHQFLQHSSSRVENVGGRKEDFLIVIENEVEWGLNDILDVENLELVDSGLLDKAILDLGDWISAEVDREVRVHQDDGRLGGESVEVHQYENYAGGAGVKASVAAEAEAEADSVPSVTGNFNPGISSIIFTIL